MHDTDMIDQKRQQPIKTQQNWAFLHTNRHTTSRKANSIITHQPTTHNYNGSTNLGRTWSDERHVRSERPANSTHSHQKCRGPRTRTKTEQPASSWTQRNQERNSQGQRRTQCILVEAGSRDVRVRPRLHMPRPIEKKKKYQPEPTNHPRVFQHDQFAKRLSVNWKA